MLVVVRKQLFNFLRYSKVNAQVHLEEREYIIVTDNNK